MVAPVTKSDSESSTLLQARRNRFLFSGVIRIYKRSDLREYMPTPENINTYFFLAIQFQSV